MSCIRCHREASIRIAGFCVPCLLDLRSEAEQEVRHELVEAFRSELNESTEAIWNRLTK